MSAFVHEPRKQFTPKERAALFEKAGGRCQNCTRKIMGFEDWDIDHVLPLACGGTNDEENLQVLCPSCHGRKTPDDVSDAAKIKRVAIKHSVPKRHRQKRGWWR